MYAVVGISVLLWGSKTAPPLPNHATSSGLTSHSFLLLSGQERPHSLPFPSPSITPLSPSPSSSQICLSRIIILSGSNDDLRPFLPHFVMHESWSSWTLSIFFFFSFLIYLFHVQGQHGSKYSSGKGLTSFYHSRSIPRTASLDSSQSIEQLHLSSPTRSTAFSSSFSLQSPYTIVHFVPPSRILWPSF